MYSLELKLERWNIRREESERSKEGGEFEEGNNGQDRKGTNGFLVKVDDFGGALNIITILILISSDTIMQAICTECS